MESAAIYLGNQPGMAWAVLDGKRSKYVEVHAQVCREAAINVKVKLKHLRST